MSGKTGGEGVEVSPAGLSGTGAGPVGAAVAPILPVSPVAVAGAALARTGEANTKEAARATLDRPEIFNMGDSHSEHDRAGLLCT